MSAIPKTMKGVRFHSVGNSSVLRVEDDIPVPNLGDTEILVKMDYAGINFVDIYQRSGLYPVQLPATAGREGAGTVVKLGARISSLSSLQVGDKVAIFAQGCLAEYASAPANTAMKLPSSVTSREGAAIILQGLTAWTMVQDAYKVEKGQTILVQAAAGGTGGLLVQMCKHLGAIVIGTVSSAHKAEIARKHGCDHIILYKEQDMEAEVLRLTDGKGCHAVFSGIGQATFAADLACTRRKGTLVSYGNSSGAVINFKILDLSKKNVKLVRPTLANYIAEREEFAERSQQLLELVGSKAVSIEFGGQYSFDSVHTAQDDLTGQKTTGKLIIKIKS